MKQLSEVILHTAKQALQDGIRIFAPSLIYLERRTKFLRFRFTQSARAIWKFPTCSSVHSASDTRRRSFVIPLLDLKKTEFFSRYMILQNTFKGTTTNTVIHLHQNNGGNFDSWLHIFVPFEHQRNTFSSLEDLANQYKIRYTPIRGHVMETYFKGMAEIEEKFYTTWKDMALNESMVKLGRERLPIWDYPVSDKYTKIWRVMQESKFPKNLKEAVNRILTSEEEFAVIADTSEIKYEIRTNCQLQQVGTEFAGIPYAFAVQKGQHSLKDRINKANVRVNFKEKWWLSNANKVRVLQMSHFHFYIYKAGLLRCKNFYYTLAKIKMEKEDPIRFGHFNSNRQKSETPQKNSKSSIHKIYDLVFTITKTLYCLNVFLKTYEFREK
ncbi:unnamed protein product [Cylicostephanus goldi]|uniref:Ionotropic glutamate receptor C-terminal domain-containing protein n=1 Tax=Cylicostephanus goldi TaxID=71465 RepID=A0A3P6S3G4_CYLGO|nr:unnamed protein product [Cylicostephanus goldi]